MTTSTTKWIAVLAMFASLLTTRGALAKGGPGKGGSGGNSHTSSHNFSAFKMSGNSSSTNHSNSINGISKKNLNPSLTFKKQDFNKDFKKNGGGDITLGNNLKFDKKFDKKLDKKFDSKDSSSRRTFAKRTSVGGIGATRRTVATRGTSVAIPRTATRLAIATIPYTTATTTASRTTTAALP
jgi:hypothetical protein